MFCIIASSGFDSQQVHFTEDDSARVSALMVLVGANGSGKTFIQAIAAAFATTQIKSPPDLAWIGFVFDGFSANHPGFAKVKSEMA